MSPAFTKHFHRTFWKGRRAALTEAVRTKSAKICETIASSPAFANAQQIALYTSRPWEVDLKALWELAPHKCFFPRSNGQDLSMEFYKIKTWADLKPGYAGISEPPALAMHRAQSWDSTDLILIPGVCFDTSGARIGSGMGFYDRFLPSNPGIFWGVCLEEQVCDSVLAQEATDVRMVALCTEAGLRASLIRTV